MTEAGNALSRNPNVCASCSSMTDGMEASNLPECRDAHSVLSEEPIKEHAEADSEEILASHHTWTGV